MITVWQLTIGPLKNPKLISIHPTTATWQLTIGPTKNLNPISIHLTIDTW
jgi:hypothetical protein